MCLETWSCFFPGKEAVFLGGLTLFVIVEGEWFCVGGWRREGCNHLGAYSILRVCTLPGHILSLKAIKVVCMRKEC